ncbi:MAG: LVIVD repeat-containing protein [Candidatus Heimdallarchaeota archaeon]
MVSRHNVQTNILLIKKRKLSFRVINGVNKYESFRKRTLQVIAFLIIILPLLSVTTIQITGYVKDDQMLMCKEETFVYTEDFDDALYMDPITNADGWETSTLTGERDIEVLPLGFLETPHDARGLAIQGRKAYVAFYNDTSLFDSFGCIDLRDPTDLKLLSTRHSFTGMTSIAIDGDKLFVGKQNSTALNYALLGSYNASDPFNLGNPAYFLDSYNSGGPVTDIDIEGRLVYFTSYNDASGKSLRIADTENPDLIVEYTPNWNSAKALGVEVTYPLAYIAASDEGFYILNVSNKNAPIELGHINLPGNATEVLLDGHIAYVTLGEAGVVAIDVANPAAPEILATYDTPGIANNMALQGNTLFVTCGPAGVVVLDVADKNHISYATGFNLENAWDIGLYGGIVVVTSDLGVHTFQCSAVGRGIADIGTTYYENTFSDYEVWDVRVVGDIAYIAGGPDGFYTLNVRDPKNPILLDNHTTLSTIYRKIDVNGPYAYLVGKSIVSVYDIQDPTDIKLIHSFGGNDLGDVFIAGNTLYVTWMQGGMAIFNATTPDQFNFVANKYAEFYFGTNTTAISVSGYHLYTVDNLGGVGNGIFINNQIDMTAPYLVGSRSYSVYEQDIYVDGDIAFTADTNWCVLHNLTDPTNPIWLGDLRNGTSGSYIKTNAVWGFGPYAIAAGPDGVFMVNTTDFNSFEASWYARANNALAVTTSGDFTYIANRTSLIILRHFKSAADTYTDTFRFAQSNAIFSAPAHGEIASAIIDFDGWIPADTQLAILLSHDPSDVANWVGQTSGVAYTLPDGSKDLFWRVLFAYEDDRSPHLYELTITITYKGVVFDIADPLWIGLIAGAAGLLLIILVVVIVVTIKKKKKVSTR